MDVNQALPTLTAEANVRRQVWRQSGRQMSNSRQENLVKNEDRKGEAKITINPDTPTTGRQRGCQSQGGRWNHQKSISIHPDKGECIHNHATYEPKIPQNLDTITQTATQLYRMENQYGRQRWPQTKTPLPQPTKLQDKWEKARSGETKLTNARPTSELKSYSHKMGPVSQE